MVLKIDDFSRSLYLFSTCLVCTENDKQPSRVLSVDQQKMVFVKRGILIPSGSRCRENHLYNDHLTHESLQSITDVKTDMVSLNADAAIQLLDDCCQIIRGKKTFDFDDPTSLDEKAYYNITGLQKGIEYSHCHLSLCSR